MEKVFLVYCVAGSFEDSVKWVQAVCKDEFSAEDKKIEIQKEIDLCKMYYSERTKGRDFHKDCKNYVHLPNRYRNLINEFEDRYPQLKISKIYLEEREVI